MPPRLKIIPTAMALLLVIMVYLLTLRIDISFSNVPEISKTIEPTDDPNDYHIHSVERFLQPFKMKGHVFSSEGVYKELEHKMVSSLIHTFSPYTENRFREIMLEPRHEQRVYANSPALLWQDNKLICVMRIWLEKEAYREGLAPKPANDFNDNYLYIQKYSKHMRPITPGSILGIPTPRQWIIGDGPIEPRLFKVKNGEIYLSFNTGVYLEDGKPLDGTFIWDYQRHKVMVPTIEGGSPIMKTVTDGRMPRDKHWTPYNDQTNELKMIYNLDPLRVLSCSTNFSCKFVHFEGEENYEFQQFKDTLRGGTPWLLHEYPYYISIGHSTLFKMLGDDRVYTINLIVYKADPIPRVVYLSSPIDIHKKPMQETPIVRKSYIQDPFFFPVSILKEDEDTIAIGGHINDYSSVLLRVRGIKRVLEDVLEADRNQPDTMKGPSMGTLHETSKRFATEYTGFEFHRP